jgi:hypothetical protein
MCAAVGAGVNALTCAEVAGRCSLGAEPVTWLSALLDGTEDQSGTQHRPTPSPTNPGIPDVAWSQASTLSRAALCTAADLLARRPDLDRGTLPLIWVTGLGELRATEQFLTTLLKRGRGRPRAFRDSVHNTAASLISTHLGLRGSLETLAAGWSAAGSGLLRAEALVARHGACLLLGGDDGAMCFDEAAQARSRPPGRLAVAGAILEADGPGPVLSIDVTGRPLGPQPASAPTLWAMGPDGPATPAGAIGLSDVLGGAPSTGIVALVACVASGRGQVVERSGRSWLRSAVGSALHGP